ncbi:uncharacterized protein MYCFIDRAFT_171010 [Pseudocercospora fijiensis CIRAD86]|uniref:Isopenicillin N synthase-like Fe(2+) 2OG dioxygenase domain-containing protein n=1 Tax=Pseudocercospora fijiensis (strain CIRAD86) TaxID=383855 RepID=N1Q9K8_PSEFD|nr:uncharacterized protein MYCFIDRAFT_171010 [Pseudocercospora fijiensis CIRAD86]EME89580.1 hypothetical protein MYCFIDRAFT_171010 [Pseudocercospora fijiensis CIRAD86]
MLSTKIFNTRYGVSELCTILPHPKIVMLDLERIKILLGSHYSCKMKEGLWIEAPLKPGTMVINVGQVCFFYPIISDSLCLHRVRNKTGAERFSLPVFFSQDPGANIDVIETCLEDGETKPEPYNVGELYVRRILPEELKYDMLRT